MILHLIPAEKFTTDYINRIFRLFNKKEHYFVVFGENKKEYRLSEIKYKGGVSFTLTLRNLGSKFEELVNSCNKIICHSLFFKLIDLFYLNRLVTKHNVCLIWDIWGKDLYEDYDKSKGLKAYLTIKPVVKEGVRRSLIRKMDIFITTGDFDILKDRYTLKSGAKAMGAQYTYNLLNLVEHTPNEKIHIMVGHSATDTCRHLETFELLKPYAGKIKVFCPLSYPNDTEYINSVSEVGRKIFGDDYVPMTDFMKYEEYVEFLNTVDIGVFNNSRQQGMGNITNLLYLGKKVYLSEDNTIRKSYSRPNYYIFDCNEIGKSDFLILLSEKQAEINRNKIIYKFSDQNFYDEWRNVFEN